MLLEKSTSLQSSHSTGAAKTNFFIRLHIKCNPHTQVQNLCKRIEKSGKLS